MAQAEFSEIPTQSKMRKKIGEGGFGKVYLYCDPNTSLLFAIKHIKLVQTKANISQFTDKLRNEIQILSSIKHERIVQYYGCEESKEEVLIFLEYMPGGSLYDHMHDFGPFNEAVTRRMTRQILQGLAFLHESNIIHRDIKAANILRDTVGNVKVTDFGVSKQLTSITEAGPHTTVGSFHWLAPEIITSDNYGKNVDLWSLGCTVVELLTTKPPFADIEPIQVILKIASCKHPEYTLPKVTSENLREFLNITFKKDWNARTSALKLLEHPFVEVCKTLEEIERKDREINKLKEQKVCKASDEIVRKDREIIILKEEKEILLRALARYRSRLNDGKGQKTKFA
ncbi:mitogen-activated protein kinase kinase kinase 3-like isoform X3 [Biomphalaria glabrata]|nr:mitogen-activated protein kinase kinase kinase 3-like isoform X3 [Biomphalaria glabrata]